MTARIQVQSPGTEIISNLVTKAITSSGSTLDGTEGFVNVSASGATITLAPGVDGQILSIKNDDSTTGTTVDPDGTETIERNSSLSLPLPLMGVILQFYNRNWNIIADVLDTRASTFTGTLSDTVGPVTATFTYSFLSPNVVALTGAITGTSTGTTATVTGLPAAITPTSGHSQYGVILDNSLGYFGRVIVSNGGTLILEFSSTLGSITGVFTPLGTKGLGFTTIVYSLD